MTTADEDDLLRSVAIQNAQSILAARQRAEREILQAKEELERKTRELAHSLAMMRATLDSTWDGIMVTDETGRVTGFNQKLVEMWHIPTERLERRQHGDLIEFFARQFTGTDPASFRARIDDIYDSSPAAVSTCSSFKTAVSSNGIHGSNRSRDGTWAASGASAISRSSGGRRMRCERKLASSSSSTGRDRCSRPSSIFQPCCRR